MASAQVPAPWSNSVFSDIVDEFDGALAATFLNGDILKIVKCNNYNIPASCIIIHQFHLADENISEKAIESSIRRMIGNIKSHVKNIKRNADKLRCLLEQNYVYPKSCKRPIPTDPEKPVDLPPLKLKKDCEKCPEFRSSFSTKSKSLKDRIKNLKKINISLKRQYDFKRVNQTLKRKQEIIIKQKSKINSLQSRNRLLEKKINIVNHDHVDSILSKVKKLKRQLKDSKLLVSKREEELHDLKGKLKELEQEVQRLQIQVLEIEEKGSENAVRDENTLKAYSLKLRKCLYNCLLCNVPVEKAGMLVDFIWTQASDNSIKTPGPTTISQLAFELGALSDLQIGEFINKSSHCTLAWDATSKQGVHVNEVHLCLDAGTFTLQIGEIPGGKTEDYFQQISDTITNIAKTYSLYTDESFADTLQRFQDAITSTLTDRAPVNNCVSAALSVFLNRQLIVLNCNVHPLDGLATATRKTLKNIDAKFKIQSAIYGTECHAANLLYALSKLRYKDGPGDPAGFKNFLETNGIQPGVIVRYRGNRLHVMFHLAGVVINMKEKLILYLKKYCTAAKLRLALLSGLQNEEILVQLQVLGLLGKTITGPWMTLFYKNADGKHHLEMIPYMKMCLSALSEFESNPHLLLTTDSDVFGNPFNDDTLVLSIRLALSSPNFDYVAKEVVSAMKGLLQRQLSQYLDGTLAAASSQVLEMTKHAPVSNMHSERALGMFDYQVRRAPNATIGFIDGKRKARLNKTLPWFCEKSDLLQRNIVNFVIPLAARQRKKHAQRSAEVRSERSQRHAFVSQKRDQTERKKIEKLVQMNIETKAVDDILQNLDNSLHSFVKSILKFDPTCINTTFQHMWNVDGRDILYSGKITGFVHRKHSSLLVDYNESTSTIPIKEFIADMIMGDISSLDIV